MPLFPSRTTHRRDFTGHGLQRSGRAIALTAGLLVPAAMHSARALTWDANNTGVGQTDGAGVWLGTDQWWDGLVNTSWSSGQDAVFGNGGAGGAVTLASPTTVNSLTFNAFTGTYTIGTAGQTITLNAGVTKSAGAVASIISPILLSGVQTWSNNSGSALNVTGGLNNGGNLLTIDGTGSTSFAGTANVITGAGGITKNGTGTLFLGAGGTTPAHNYTGPTTINGGTVMVFGNKTAGNFTLNNGILTDYFQQTTTFSGGLGSGNNQIQIFGDSGFGGGNGLSTWRIGAGGSSLQWGSAFFNPTSLKFFSPADNMGPSIFGQVALDNGLDLNGGARTIDVLAATGANALSSSWARINGNITGAGGSLIKIGGGTLVLQGANSYDGSTTISAGQLTANSSGALGNGSATNTLIFDGGALRAGGNIASGATRSVTLNNTATIDSNGFAVSFAGALTGAGGLTKNGAGTLSLSGSNNYGGPTVVNAGAVQFATQSALYNANPSSWTAANLNVKAGATLAVNVDSAGAAGFDAANLNTLLSNVSVAGSASSGLQSGAILALDTGTATGLTFTPGNAIADSTGAFGGRISLVKQGAGTLVVNQANTYTGPTTISAGTLRLDAGGAISMAPMLNNGTLQVNRSGTVTTGVDLPSAIGGTGAVDYTGGGSLVINAPTYHTGNTTATAGNITLSHQRAIHYSALDTTGAGTVTLSGVTTPVFGGLSNSGAARNLASVIDGSYGSVTGLTLNPQTGATYTYAGVIANGAAGMSLTMDGPGTQMLTGNSTFTGATILNRGTLHAGTNTLIGRLTGTSGYTFNGGTLQFNRSTNANIDALSDSAPLTSNGGMLAIRSNDAGGINATENIGAATVNEGQMNFNWSNGASSGARVILTGLTLNSSLTAAGQTAAVTFSGALADNGRWGVAGSGTTTAGQIIGPWATTGAANGIAAQTDYAVYNSNFIAPAGIAATAENTWGVGANATLTLASAGSLTGTRTLNSLRYTGNAQTLALGANSLETHGLLNGGSGLLTLTAAGGALTTPSGGGNLFITTGSNAITVSAPVNNNGGAVTLVKSGSGGTLILGSTSSTYSGGTIINAGILSVTADTNLGAAAGGITFTGGQLTVQSSNIPSMNRIMTVEDAGGIIQVNKNNNLANSGKLSGAGTLTLRNPGGGGGAPIYAFTSTANDFTGTLVIQSGTAPSVNSFADSPNSIVINNTGDIGTTTFSLGTGAIAPLVFNNRAFEIHSAALATPVTIQNLNTTHAFTINTDLIATGTGIKTLGLAASAGPANLFAGNISDGAGGGSVLLTKSGAGRWDLTGANTYSGKTTISAGTLSINSIQNAGSLTPNALGTPASGSNSVIDLGNTGSLRYTGSGHASDRGINLTTAAGGTFRLDASGSGTFALSGAVTSAGTSGTSILRLDGAGVGEVGAISNGANPTALHKAGAGTWTLTAGNTFTGSTTVFEGSLALGAGGSIADNSTLTLNGATAVFDLGANKNETVSTVTLIGGGSIQGTGTSTLTTTGSFNLQSGSVAVRLAGVGRALNKTTAGTVTLEGINTYSGATDITGGGTIILNNPASANNISGSPLVNVAAGNFLNVTGLNGGSLTLASGQTLKGGGTVTGGLVIGSGATLSPGASPGTLSTVGNVTYGPAGTYVWEVNNATGTKGVDQGWDWHNITGTLDSTGTVGTPFTIAITGLNTANALGTVANWNPHTSRTWIIATASGGISGFSPSDFSLDTANFFNNNAPNSLGDSAFSLSQVGNDLVLNFSGSAIATAYWDTNGATAGAGATPTGTWSNTGGLFSYSPAGTLATGNWVANNIAVFAAGSGAGTYTVTVGAGGVSASGLVVEDGAMTLSGNSLTLTGATPAITVNSAQPFTLNSTVLGTAGLTKLGAGVATLTGPNTYTGGTTLTAGRVQLGGTPVGSVGSITSSEIGLGDLVFNGGALSSADTAARTVLNPVVFTGSATIGDAVNNGTVTFADTADLGSASRTITVAANSAARFDGVISGASGAGITVRGDGALVPNAANTYDGPTNIGGGTGLTGTIRVASGNELALGANPALFNQNQLRLNGGTLQVSVANLTIDDANRGVSAGPGGGTFQVDSGRTLNLATPGAFEAAAIGSTFIKSGAGTFNLSAAANYNALRVEDGVYRQSAGVSTVAESSGTGLRVASGAVYDLAGGVLRTDRIDELSGGTFTWGAGRLTAFTDNATEGSTDFSSSNNPGSPVVYVGNTVQVTAASVETTAGSILQAHGSPTLYQNLGTRFNNYAFSGILNLSALGDILEVDLNPSLLRPNSAYVEFGSIPLVYADSILGEFDQFNGLNPDALPFLQYLGVYNTLLPPTQMPENHWYLEYAKNVVDPIGAPSPATNGSGAFDVIYLHYNFGLNSVNVPEPATLPLLGTGIWALRLITRRRRKNTVDEKMDSAPRRRVRRY